jgi:steroid delta-isomerase-like uncharacterized protein
MRRFRLLQIALLVMCCGMTLAGQKKPAEQRAQNANAEHNKTTARRVFEDLWSQGRVELVNTLYESNAIVHVGNRNIPLSEMVSEGKEWRSAFPDLVVRVNRITESGDMVDVNWTARGTNKGQAKGMPGKGKPATSQGTSKFRFDSAGKIAEVWVEWDENNVRRQAAGK